MSLAGLHCLAVFCFIISDIQKHVVQVLWKKGKNSEEEQVEFVVETIVMFWRLGDNDNLTN